MTNFKTLTGSIALAALLSNAASALDEPVVDIPFDLSTGRPVVDLMVNGEGPFPFVFDTGAAGFVMRPQLAEQLGLEVTGEGAAMSPGGASIPVDMVTIDSVSLDAAVTPGRDVMLIDSGRPIEVGGYGVFGPMIFDAYGRVAFDFENERLEIGGDFNKPDDMTWIPMGDGAPLLETVLRLGDLEMPVHIDTGSPGILTLPYASADDLPLEGPVEVTGQIRLVDGAMNMYGAPINAAFELGDATIPVTNVRLFEREFANIGSGGLRGLQLEIDWTNQRFAIWGEAEPVEPRRPQRRPRPQQ